MEYKNDIFSGNESMAPTHKEVCGIHTYSEFINMFIRLMRSGILTYLPGKYQIIDSFFNRAVEFNNTPEMESASIRQILKITCLIRERFDHTQADEYDEILGIINEVMTGKK